MSNLVLSQRPACPASSKLLRTSGIGWIGTTPSRRVKAGHKPCRCLRWPADQRGEVQELMSNSSWSSSSSGQKKTSALGPWRQKMRSLSDVRNRTRSCLSAKSSINSPRAHTPPPSVRSTTSSKLAMSWLHLLSCCQAIVVGSRVLDRTPPTAVAARKACSSSWKVELNCVKVK